MQANGWDPVWQLNQSKMELPFPLRDLPKFLMTPLLHWWEPSPSLTAPALSLGASPVVLEDQPSTLVLLYTWIGCPHHEGVLSHSMTQVGLEASEALSIINQAAVLTWNSCPHIFLSRQAKWRRLAQGNGKLGPGPGDRRECKVRLKRERRRRDGGREGVGGRKSKKEG